MVTDCCPTSHGPTAPRGQAYGKVILVGEHGVVYGVPAIAAGIDRGAEAEAVPASVSTLTLGSERVHPGDSSELGRAFEALLEVTGSGPVHVSVKTALPPGSGLGASAAIGVAIARALLHGTHEPDGTLARVLKAAHAWESVFHGNPSGIDAAAAALGGCLWYVRDEGAKPLRLARDLDLAIAVAGPPAPTRHMVAEVARLKQRRPELFDRSLAGLRSLSHNARTCIEVGDLDALGKLMDLNQMLLSGLLVSTEEIERACQLARGAGALGAKLTGAGGGGCVVALTGPKHDAILEAWRAAGIECFACTVRTSSEEHPHP
jgi:mevalonate kinase